MLALIGFIALFCLWTSVLVTPPDRRRLSGRPKKEARR